MNGSSDDGWVSATSRTVRDELDRLGTRSTQEDVPPEELRADAVDSGQGYWIAQLRNARHGGLAASCRHELIHLTRSDALRCAKRRRQHLIAIAASRGEWSPQLEDQPREAPFPLGARVLYIGLGSRDLENGIPIHRWEVGIVVRVEAPGAAGTEDSPPEDGYSVIRFHGIEGEEDTVLPRFDEDGDWRVRYRLADEDDG